MTTPSHAVKRYEVEINSTDMVEHPDGAYVTFESYDQVRKQLEGLETFWTKEYEGKSPEWLMGECISRAVCRDSDFRKMEELEAKLEQVRKQRDDYFATLNEVSYRLMGPPLTESEAEKLLRKLQSAIAAAEKEGE